MACEVCEHCHGALSQHEAVMREGYSYHKECNKCYVCSETNLQNAEIFKGVIFCSSCSQRIFQGCSTARQTKNSTKSKRTRSRSHQRRRERSRGLDRRSKKPKLQRESGVIELARMAHSTDTDSNPESYLPVVKSSKTIVTKLKVLAGSQLMDAPVRDLKQQSTEMGITTEFTQQLLKQINCPVVEWKTTTPAKPIQKYFSEDKRNKPECSDLRIAELGASTEIANMALRKQTEDPVNVKSQHRLKKMKSINLSMLSDVSACGLEDWLETAYSTLHRSEKSRLLDKSMGSILKMPFTFFKTRVMNRSSLVSLLMSECGDRYTLLNRFKMLFHEEITEHHRRGVKRLYSTINRRKIPYKLGWLHLAAIASEKGRPSPTSSLRQQHSKNCGCKHFRHSHSYRCLRAHIMKRAGPTKSQLAMFRRNILNRLSPAFLRRLFELIFSTRRAIMTSEACGNSNAHDRETSKTLLSVDRYSG